MTNASGKTVVLTSRTKWLYGFAGLLVMVGLIFYFQTVSVNSAGNLIDCGSAFAPASGKGATPGGPFFEAVIVENALCDAERTNQMRVAAIVGGVGVLLASATAIGRRA
ncbi:hypothetical protein LQL77_31925 [Rhodococcus cerastii]|nr:hypothetical protein [Rhodococcus cerastii]